MASDGVRRQWAWLNGGWIQGGLTDSNPNPVLTNFIEIPPASSVQRLIYRHGGALWYAKAYENPIPSPATAELAVEITGGYGEGIQSPIFSATYPCPWANGWVTSTSLDGFIYWTGYIPAVEKDMSLRRAAGIEAAHAYRIVVTQTMVFRGEDPHGQGNFYIPGWSLTTDWQVLTAGP